MIRQWIFYVSLAAVGIVRLSGAAALHARRELVGTKKSGMLKTMAFPGTLALIAVHPLLGARGWIR